MLRTFLRAYATAPKIPSTGMSINPYAIFVKEHFAQNSSQGGSNVEIVKKLSADWKKLSAEQKNEYQKKSKEYREEKISEFLQLDAKTQQLKIEEAKEKKVEKAKRRERKEKREEWKANGHPQLPPNAYAIYIKEFVEAKKSSGTSVVELVKTGAQNWNKMTDGQKEKYQKHAKTLNEEYHSKLAQWKETQKEKK
ncbi:unnamed protein product [Caenorhabditis angaria]|uniref:HMG box domain-containing protein n=1 Tax=Caenorhabditis angaria TaxID=860376 RepID=A0A9P1IRS2_9PELO|nr:unnamed protein product [Caenorhabditis angaria]